jgi:hypothetical protein
MKRNLSFLLTLFIILLPACSGFPGISLPRTESQSTTSQPYPVTMITFRVELPLPAQPGEKVYLSVLDEVTGLAYNPQRYIMQADDARHFTVILPFAMQSMVKYRYILEKDRTVTEALSNGETVRYRLYHVNSPGITQDVVSRWSDAAYALPMGRITGRIVDSKVGLPIPGIMVTAGGAQALTSGDGSYIIEGLPPGTHNLVAYARDGLFQPFQQGALVAADSTTQAPIMLQPAELVNIAFTLKIPEGTPSFIPIRLAGSLSQLGNSFAALDGGVSIHSGDMPVLTRGEDGLYRLTLTMSVGADVWYKYTLGDGLWNAEHDAQGDFKLRQLIVPAADTQINDEVGSWGKGSQGALTFDVTVPQSTPSDETISIQFNPGIGWTEPIPMGSAGQNRWLFTLYSPLGGLETLQYRYCRGDQCGIADDAQTMGSQAAGRVIQPGTADAIQKDQITGWAFYPAAASPPIVPNVQILPRGESFMAGVEFQSTYSPAWAAHFTNALSVVKSLGANWAVFTPTWTATRQAPPHLEAVPGQDMDPNQLSSVVLKARELQLKNALYPRPRFDADPGAWFVQAPRDFAWWVTWFDRYRLFVLNFTDLAQQNGANALILGGDWLAPALPHGLLPDGSASGVPEDAETRWRTLIQEVRTRFSGTMGWAISYPVGFQNQPPFLDALDLLYVEFSPALADQPGASEADLAARAAGQLDNDVLPFQQRWNKPLVLAAGYPSAAGGITGCLPNPAGGCLAFSALDQPQADSYPLSLDLNEQANAYNALLLAVNGRTWISGFVSQGFYPPVPLQDTSSSVHGKPASGVLWFWYPHLLGK